MRAAVAPGPEVEVVTEPAQQRLGPTRAPFNQVASLSDPLSHTTMVSYDSVGNLTVVTDALSHTTTFTHDAQGNVLTITTPLSQTTDVPPRN